MDNQLNSLIKINDANGTARIDARGSLTQASRPELILQVAAGFRPLSNYSSHELLAASDSVFALLDDPAGRSGHELLARYEAIGEEIARRESTESAGKHATPS
jgi:hypothetical protein